ncbi:MAG: phosphoglucosamine mutase [Thioalkalivibrionaceae bacterium]
MGQWFGTDGIRGRAGDEPMTPDFALRLGYAVGRTLVTANTRQVLVGKDTRVSGYLFESAIEAGLAAAGADVALLGPMPTPAVAYLTRTFRAAAGIVISASHNPYYDNGFKFFTPDGDKLSDELEANIERLLSEPKIRWDLRRPGKASRISDAQGRYIEFCKSALPARADLHGLKLVIDCAHGATYALAPKVFAELGAEIDVIGDQPDGYNINEARGAMDPAALSERVCAVGADFGIAFDGDGDRVVLVDARGELVDGDRILGILALARHRRGVLAHAEGVVGTVMSNQGLVNALGDAGIPFERVPVGDRHILQRLRSRGWHLGGEGSGHIVCLSHTTTGDGIVAALMVAEEVLRRGEPLAALAAEIPMFPQRLVNVRLPTGCEAQPVLDDDRVSALVRDVEAALGQSGRVLLRASGTEPLIRVMVEGVDVDVIAEYADRIAAEVRDAVG